ncbi:hypothetical protein ABKN59_004952 [Abortiporus biennis]
MANPNPNPNSGPNPNSAGGTGGASLGQKIKGAAEVVHGLGESVRGQFMDIVDHGTSTNKQPHPETLNGRMEVERGMARLRGIQPQDDVSGYGGQQNPNSGVSASTTDPKGDVNSIDSGGQMQGYNSQPTASGPPGSMPLTSGLGAGTGGAKLPPQYGSQSTSGNDMNMASGQYDGSNNREFQSGYGGPRNSNARRFGTGPGPGPGPDASYKVPGTGIGSDYPQKTGVEQRYE